MNCSGCMVIVGSRAHRGFPLTELMVVVVIVAAAIAIKLRLDQTGLNGTTASGATPAVTAAPGCW